MSREKAFDETYHAHIGYLLVDEKMQDVRVEVKSAVLMFLDKQREEIVRKLEAMKKTHETHPDGWTWCGWCGRNRGLNEAIVAIKNTQV